MDKFLQQMQSDLEKKILSCVKGESIVKPFSQVYQRAIEKKESPIDDKKGTHLGDVYLGDKSIYMEIIGEYLRDNPGFFNKDFEDLDNELMNEKQESKEDNNTNNG